MGEDDIRAISDKYLSEFVEQHGMKLDLSKDVNAMLNNWINISKILGEKYKVKEYKQLKKFIKNNK